MAFERFKALAPLLLSQSTEHERELLAGALNGDPESRRVALYLASTQFSEGRALSPALEHWLGDVLLSLSDAVNSGGSIDDALAQIGYQKRRGRPPDDTIDRDVRILAAVRELATVTTKSEAVTTVASALGIAESAVWKICKDLANVRGAFLCDEFRQLIVTSLQTAPLIGSKELRDFLAVTDRS